MAMPQRDETIEEIKRLDALLEYAVMHEDEAEAVSRATPRRWSGAGLSIGRRGSASRSGAGLLPPLHRFADNWFCPLVRRG